MIYDTHSNRTPSSCAASADAHTPEEPEKNYL